MPWLHQSVPRSMIWWRVSLPQEGTADEIGRGPYLRNEMLENEILGWHVFVGHGGIQGTPSACFVALRWPLLRSGCVQHFKVNPSLLPSTFKDPISTTKPSSAFVALYWPLLQVRCTQHLKATKISADLRIQA